MANVNEGLEIEGETRTGGDLSDADFNRMLSEQARGGSAGDGAVPALRIDPSQQTAEEIVSGLFSGEVTTTKIADGLTIGGDNRPQNIESLRRQALADTEAFKKSDPGWDAYETRKAQKAAQPHQEAARDEELATTRFQVDRLEAVNDEELAFGLARLKRSTSEEVYDAYLSQVAHEDLGLDPDEDLNDYEADDLDERLRELRAHTGEAEAVINTNEEIRRRNDMDRAAAILSRVANDEAALDRAFRLGAWQQEKGLRKVEAEGRYLVARELGLQYGVDLEQLSGEDFSAQLEALNATASEADRAVRVRALHQQLLDTPSTAVGDGLERFTPFGWQRVNHIDLDSLPLGIDPERAAARAVSKRLTSEDIRRAMTAPERTSVAHGLTNSQGRPISMSEAVDNRFDVVGR